MMTHNMSNLLVEGITNEMANFITMSLDPNAANLYKLMSNQVSKAIPKS